MTEDAVLAGELPREPENYPCGCDPLMHRID